ncbi:DUF1800 family protein [Paraferrimonas sp. SM1919]|uniref:DUF1800 domain-containing protein n=1 Tax=Paraferrimonas sp. SM1919 TaxID=2662263 RepID=UPI0013D5A393|nr:DUF1800 domain-containing protein [Paraferrimonas sp. SM1919]
MDNATYIALTRFGLGINPSLSPTHITHPKSWLLEQCQSPLLLQQGLSSTDSLKSIFRYRQLKAANKKRRLNQDEQQQFKQLQLLPRKNLIKHATEVAHLAIHSASGIQLRLFDFFSNHFSITTHNKFMKFIAPSFEQEVIAAHLNHRFEDMLLASCQHPAMLVYLNNELSIGPDSFAGKKKTKNINENLAREILELHTLGVEGPYNQQDVEQLALALTGWSIPKAQDDFSSPFLYRKGFHQPGPKTLLKITFRQKDHKQAQEMLKMLANHPATAKHISYKLAQYFISDKPEPKLVNKLTQSYLASRGHIPTLMKALIEAPECWQPIAQKFKTPREFVISSLRASNTQNGLAKKWLPILKSLGQLPFQAGSPAGYSVQQVDWLSPNNMYIRANFAYELAARWQTKVKSVQSLVDTLFANHVSQHSSTHILRAETKQQALTMILMSPEFLKR